MTTLLFHLEQHLPCSISAQTHIETALSGGLDSVVLLHLLAQLQCRLKFKLTAVHVHHGLQDKADSWLQFCQQYCDTLNIPLRAERVQVVSDGIGIEAGARAARYAVFEKTSADILAMAHHADDQVETFMLAALRGGGLRALAAMPTVRKLNQHTFIWRPLLNFSRTQLAEYAQQNQLMNIEDPSNSLNDYLRNWLRNQALPQWREHRPHLNQHILSSIELLQEELEILEEVATSDLAAIQTASVFDVNNWRKLPSARRRLALLKFAQQQSLGTPAKASIQNFADILFKLGNASATWQTPHGTIQAYQNQLFVLEKNWQSQLMPSEQSGKLCEILAEQNWQLKRAAYGLSPEFLMQHGTIRTVLPSDTLRLKTGRKAVGKLLQEWKIPPFIRPYWIVITDSDGICVAVANTWVDSELATKNGVVPVWLPLESFILAHK